MNHIVIIVHSVVFGKIGTEGIFTKMHLVYEQLLDKQGKDDGTG